MCVTVCVQDIFNQLGSAFQFQCRRHLLGNLLSRVTKFCLALYKAFYEIIITHCVVPENLHTPLSESFSDDLPPTPGIFPLGFIHFCKSGISTCPSWGENKYILEQHNLNLPFLLTLLIIYIHFKKIFSVSTIGKQSVFITSSNTRAWCQPKLNCNGRYFNAGICSYRL